MLLSYKASFRANSSSQQLVTNTVGRAVSHDMSVVAYLCKESSTSNLKEEWV